MRLILSLIFLSLGANAERNPAWDNCDDTHSCLIAIFGESTAASATFPAVRIYDGVMIDTATPPMTDDINLGDLSCHNSSECQPVTTGKLVNIAQVTPPTPLPPDSTSVTVSFSPQGDAAMNAMVGHLIKNVSMDEVTVCAPPNSTFSGGSVYQLANSLGISTLSPKLTRRLFTRTAALSKQQTTYTILKYGLLAVPIMGEAGVISIGTKSLFSLLAGHGVFDMVQTQYQPLLPDPSPFLDDLLDPLTIYTLSNSCLVATLGVEYTSKAAMKTAVKGRYTLTGGQR